MRSIALLYLILCITAILPVLSAVVPRANVGPGLPPLPSPDATVTLPVIPEADMGIPSMNQLHDMLSEQSVLVQQFITLRARRVCADRKSVV